MYNEILLLLKQCSEIRFGLLCPLGEEVKLMHDLTMGICFLVHASLKTQQGIGLGFTFCVV